MEKAFHQWLRKQTSNPASAPMVRLGMGDDAALVASDQFGFDADAYDLVIACDAIAEGTHFEIDWETRQELLPLVGRKMLAVNLSDLAAMAAVPRVATLQFQLPQRYTLEDAKLIFSGAQQIAQRYGVKIVGGDTNRWSGKMVLGATLIGARAKSVQGWTLDAARSGDQVFVTGSLGGSIHGHHLSFEPKIELAMILSERYPIHAATDVSDSLSLDMMAIATASEVAIELWPDQLPISSSLSQLPTEQQQTHALSDGEDFQLLLTVPENVVETLLDDPDVQGQLTHIGKVVSGSPSITDQSGNPIPVDGYEH